MAAGSREIGSRSSFVPRSVRYEAREANRAPHCAGMAWHRTARTAVALPFIHRPPDESSVMRPSDPALPRSTCPTRRMPRSTPGFAVHPPRLPTMAPILHS